MLEGGRHGIAFASGSAVTAAIAQFAPAGTEIVVGDDVYGGTFRYLERVHAAGGDRNRPVRRPVRRPGRAVGGAHRPDAPGLARDTDQPAVEGDRHRGDGGRRPGTRGAGGRSGRAAGRPLVVVDNTFASPALQRPLEHGADISFHSATKYLAGHSDTVVGVAVTIDDAVAERLRFLQNAMGGVPGPFDCFLVLRGIRTLHLRMERHSANGAAVAAFLGGRADVERVAYPGFGGMVSFVPSGGPARAVRICEGRACSRLPSHLAGSNR